MPNISRAFALLASFALCGTALAADALPAPGQSFKDCAPSCPMRS